MDFLKKTLNLESFYFPSFVPVNEIPQTVAPKLQNPKIKILFVGFCYEGKGGFELVEGCQLAAQKGLDLELTLVGEEAIEFSQWLDKLDYSHLSLKINRMGRLPHEKVLSIYQEHDIFCMPTRHEGEGHTNSINEAMMMSLVILCTRHGFLELVLGENCAFFLNSCSAEYIAKNLEYIHKNRSLAQEKASAARSKVLELFTSKKVFADLEKYYQYLVKGGNDLCSE